MTYYVLGGAALLLLISGGAYVFAENGVAEYADDVRTLCINGVAEIAMDFCKKYVEKSFSIPWGFIPRRLVPVAKKQVKVTPKPQAQIAQVKIKMLPKPSPQKTVQKTKVAKANSKAPKVNKAKHGEPRFKGMFATNYDNFEHYLHQIGGCVYLQ